jgi:hypothetical protein
VTKLILSHTSRQPINWQGLAYKLSSCKDVFGFVENVAKTCMENVYAVINSFVKVSKQVISLLNFGYILGNPKPFVNNY